MATKAKIETLLKQLVVIEQSGADLFAAISERVCAGVANRVELDHFNASAQATFEAQKTVLNELKKVGIPGLPKEPPSPAKFEVMPGKGGLSGLGSGVALNVRIIPTGYTTQSSTADTGLGAVVPALLWGGRLAVVVIGGLVVYKVTDTIGQFSDGAVARANAEAMRAGVEGAQSCLDAGGTPEACERYIKDIPEIGGGIVNTIIKYGLIAGAVFVGYKVVKNAFGLHVAPTYDKYAKGYVDKYVLRGASRSPKAKSHKRRYA